MLFGEGICTDLRSNRHVKLSTSGLLKAKKVNVAPVGSCSRPI